jgi:mannosyltransferase
VNADLIVEKPGVHRLSRTNIGITFILLGIFIAGAYFRLYEIGSKTIWLDEAFSIFMATKPVPEMLRLVIEIEKHPPLYYLLLHAWMQIGDDSAAWVRAFSALFGILTLPVIYLAGKQLASRKAGILAALILAINPLQIAFAQETRVYTLLTFAVTFTIWMLIRLLTDPRSFSQPIGSGFAARLKRNSDSISHATDFTWLGYILGTAGVCYLHNTGFFFPLAVNIFVFGFILSRRFNKVEGLRFSPPSIKNWIIAQLGAFLLWSPWIGPFIAQSRDLDQNFWIPMPTWEIILDTIRALLIDNLQYSGWLSFAWIPVVLLGILGLVYFCRQPVAIALLLTLFFTPILGQLLVSLRVPIFYVRALIWVPVPFFLAMAAGILSLRRRFLISAAVAMLVFFNFIGASNYFNYAEKERWDQAAAYVAENVVKDDMIIFNAGWVQIPFDYYFDDYGIAVEKVGAPATMFERGELEPIMQEADIPRLRTFLQNQERVWLVYSHQWYTDPKRLVLTTIREDFTQMQHEEFFQVDVYLYGAK